LRFGGLVEADLGTLAVEVDDGVVRPNVVGRELDYGALNE
jgi:hypothetical protein